MSDTTGGYEAGSKLQEIHSRDGWWCPSCFAFLQKPPRKGEHGERWHSYKCRTLMVRSTCVIEVRP